MKRAILISLIASIWVVAQPAQKSDDKKSQPTNQAASQTKEETTPQVDLVCGMTIEPKTAEAKYAYKGKMYYFCSREDQQEFTKSPDKYVVAKKKP